MAPSLSQRAGSTLTLTVRSSSSRPERGSSYYRPELDILRFGAFLLVFFHHLLAVGGDPRIDRIFGHAGFLFYAAVEAGRFGLSLFFTLSAFLICELLMREREVRDTISVKQFYIRRILRIWPLYYFALTLWLVWYLFAGGPAGEVGRIGWFAVFMGAVYFTTHAITSFTPLSPLWSISVEEQFYLFVPWVMKYATRRSIYTFCFVIIALANVVLLIAGRNAFTAFHVWYQSLAQFECFAAGILISLSLRHRLPQWSTARRLGAVLVCLACWMSASLLVTRVISPQLSYSSRALSLILYFALATAGSVLLLLSVLGISHRGLPPWAIYLGRISFGLYVYHAFALRCMQHISFQKLNLIAIHPYALRALTTTLLTFGVPFAITFTMAHLSYQFLESPVLRLKKRYQVIQSQPAPRLEPETVHWDKAPLEENPLPGSSLQNPA